MVFCSSIWFFALIAFLSRIFVKKDPSNFLFSLGIFLSALIVFFADTYTKFPQIHLVELRIFAFLAPITLVSIFGMMHINPSRLTIWIKGILIAVNIYLLALILASYIHSGWTHRMAYQDFPASGFPSELADLPKGAVVLTDVQYEIPYISAASDKFSYLGYGIVSAAGNQELIERLVIASRVFNWSDKRLKGNDWDELLSAPHWVYHHGAPPQGVIDSDFNSILEKFSGKSNCELLKRYQVDYIRFRENPPGGLEKCTEVHSIHLLKVIDQ